MFTIRYLDVIVNDATPMFSMRLVTSKSIYRIQWRFSYKQNSQGQETELIDKNGKESHYA